MSDGRVCRLKRKRMLPPSWKMQRVSTVRRVANVIMEMAPPLPKEAVSSNTTYLLG